jgi:hypothetical protein
VRYRSRVKHGKDKKNFELFTAEEFIAAITQHIPEKSFQMVRYFGWYSNRSRWTRKKAGLLKPGDEPLKEALIGDGLIVLDVSDYDSPLVPSKDMEGVDQEGLGGRSPCVPLVWAYPEDNQPDSGSGGHTPDT